MPDFHTTEKNIHSADSRDYLNTGFGAEIIALQSIYPTGYYYSAYVRLFREFNRKLDGYGMGGLIPADSVGAGFWAYDISEYFDPSEPVLDDVVDEFVLFSVEEVFYNEEQVTV